MPARPNAKEVKWFVFGGRTFAHIVLGSFDDEETANKYRDSCEQWYGRDHPMAPFSVDTVEHYPPMWPNMSAISDDNLTSMFDQLTVETSRPSDRTQAAARNQPSRRSEEPTISTLSGHNRSHKAFR